MMHKHQLLTFIRLILRKITAKNPHEVVDTEKV